MSAVLLVLVLALGPAYPAAEQPSGPKLGLQTWTLRKMTFDQVVDFAARNRIQYLQLIGSHLDPGAPVRETRRKLDVLKERGLIPYTFGVVPTSAGKEANRKLFEFARQIGAKLIMVEPDMADWDSLEALVKEYDIKLAIHNHGAGTRYGDPEVVKRILSTRDSRIGVCLDVGWITAAGFDAAQVFREYGDRVFDIHLKDKKIPAAGEGNPVDTLPGAGDANYAGLFAEIRKSGWSGVMAIETDSEEFAMRPQPFVTAAKAFFARSAPASSAPVDREDWVSLFNGRNLTDWTPKITHHKLGENVGNTFRVEDGLLKVRYDRYKSFDGQFGHLFYKTPYAYYRIVVEYRFVGEQVPGHPGAWALRNNGVMIHSQDPRTMRLDQAFPISIEAQLLGGLSDGKPRPTLNMCSPGTDVVYQNRIYPDHCLDSSSQTVNGDEWVRAELVVLGSASITHLVDGQKVLEYNLPQYEPQPMEDSDPHAHRARELIDRGYIALQSESHPIDFRKVELLNLEGCMDPKAKNYRSYYVKSGSEGCVF